MNSKKHIKNSKYLSWLLRHGATEAGLAMDAAGWVSVDALMDTTGWSIHQIRELVATNTKKRLQLVDGSIRCCQGHSNAGVPVTLEALEASWTLHSGDDSIWHCTNFVALDAIEAEGCRPVRRTHVHCTSSLDSAVGKRSKTPVGLEISVARLKDEGFETYVAPNGVVLVRLVPRNCIIGLVGMTHRGRNAESRSRSEWLTPGFARRFGPGQGGPTRDWRGSIQGGPTQKLGRTSPEGWYQPF